MLYTVIMAGGKGTRFWPKSTRRTPKQLIPFYGNKSLLQITVERALRFCPRTNMYIICNAQYARATKKAVPMIPSRHIIAEPRGRSTAACLALASCIIRKQDPHAVIIAMPADQCITKPEAFRRVVRDAASCAKDTASFITVGIKPHTPHTGFGYIERTRSLKKVGRTLFYAVDCFVEKPDRKTAERYVRRETFLWNSGIFVFTVATFFEALKQCLPALYRHVLTYERYVGTRKEAHALKRMYSNIASVSIDYGIMEHITNVFVAPSDIGWSDVGSWTAVADMGRNDRSGNMMRGSVISVDSVNTMVDADSLLVATVGVKDLIVVQTKKAILVASKKAAENVRAVVDELEKRKWKKYL